MDDVFYVDLMFFVLGINLYTPFFFIIAYLYVWLIFVYYKKENVLLRYDIKRRKREEKENEKNNNN